MRFFRKLVLWMMGLILAVLLAGGTCIFYAFRIEPYRLDVEEYDLNSQTSNTSDMKIVQFSDVHIKEDFTCEDLGKVVRKINEQEPDIVVFTGDLYDNYSVFHEDENVIDQLSQIQAKHEKIAIWGNRDYGGGASRQYETIMEQSGFTLLRNGNWYVTGENGKKILFTGLDDSMLGNPDMPEATKIYESSYDILLTHEPDKAEDYLDEEYDAVLSGHTHGGQINIPFFPEINEIAVSATDLTAGYSGGMYELGADGHTKLYVNTGIGTTHISARFGVVPEIAVFHVYL